MSSPGKLRKCLTSVDRWYCPLVMPWGVLDATAEVLDVHAMNSPVLETCSARGSVVRFPHELHITNGSCLGPSCPFGN